MSTNKQAVLVEPGRLELRDGRRPTPGAGELLIRVAACGLCNWELNHFHGRLGTCPQNLGHEITGTVAALGEGVKEFKEGDAVTGFVHRNMDGFSEYCLFTEQSTFKLDAKVEAKFALGEPLSCVVTTLQGVEAGAGDAVVVLGCGPMGLWCIQALAGGLLSALIAVDVQPERLALAKRFGATHMVNPKTEDAAAVVGQITGGRLADVVIEGTGSPTVWTSAVNYLKNGRGRMIMMSSHETAGAAFDWRPLQVKGATIKVTHPSFAADGTDSLRRAIALYNRGVFQVEPLVTHRFSLDQIQQAFEALANKPQGYLKGAVIM